MAYQYSVDQRQLILELYSGEANGSVAEVCRLFRRTYRNSSITRRTVERTIQTFHASGIVTQRFRGAARRPSDSGQEERILSYFRDNPRSSVRTAASLFGLSKTKIHSFLKRNRFHPYHATLHQGLTESDPFYRYEFCNFLLNAVEEEPNFLDRLIVSDEASFSRHGSFNTHNNHMWAPINPHWGVEHHFQQEFRVNVWIALHGTRLIGPVFLPPRLNGESYLELLQSTVEDYLDDLPLAERRVLWFQHDGAPPHNSRIVQNYLDREFQDRWIGSNGPIHWPARSPDLNPLDFFVWGCIKDNVYFTPVSDIETLRSRIVEACAAITPSMIANAFKSMVHRACMCIAIDGGIFEPFLKHSRRTESI